MDRDQRAKLSLALADLAASFERGGGREFDPIIASWLRRLAGALAPALTDAWRSRVIEAAEVAASAHNRAAGRGPILEVRESAPVEVVPGDPSDPEAEESYWVQGWIGVSAGAVMRLADFDSKRKGEY